VKLVLGVYRQKNEKQNPSHLAKDEI